NCAVSVASSLIMVSSSIGSAASLDETQAPAFGLHFFFRAPPKQSATMRAGWRVKPGNPMSMDDDLSAVRAVLAGDVSAFGAIVQRWQGPLMNLAFRFCRDRAQAADMAQEAFLRIFRVLPGFRQESAFSTWAISVATNVYRSHLRRAVPEMAGLEA